ncbi:MAG: hypothetical protein ABH821_05855 [archaeon]
MPAIEESGKDLKDKKVRKPKRSSVDKWKKKKWISILASPLFNQQEIGETIAEKPEKIVGRTIKVNLRNLTKEVRRSYATVFFKIKEVKGLKAYTELIGHEIPIVNIKRILSRRVSKIESNIVLESKDNKKFKIKSVIITGKKFTKSKKTALLKAMQLKLVSEAKQKNFENLMQEILFNKLSTIIQKESKKLGLIKRVEIIKTKQLK